MKQQPPALVVLESSDAFERVWPDVAGLAGVRLERGVEPTLPVPAGEACAVVVMLAGREETAPEWLTPLEAGGVTDVAVVGAAAEHRLAVGALRAGAREYFALPDDLESLRSWVVERAEGWRARDRAATLAVEEREAFDFSRIVGESTGLADALSLAARIIPRGSTTVLITGETGTGKEVLAQAIHYNGPRRSNPFVEVNCTALPPNLLEAELFGYEKGAFTDAGAAKPGLFEAAHGGTLFLDEIGDLPLELQGKLLRALEEKQIRRLGSLKSMAVDVRIIAATNVDLSAAVQDGAFRQDLFFRLSVVPIHLPPLRQRGDDVLLLTDRFLARFADEYGIDVDPLDDTVRKALLAHDWPGNVRELRNALERAMLLGDGHIRVDDLFRGGPRERAPEGTTLPFPATLDEIERAAAQRMVEQYHGNKSAAADALGISRSRLYRLLRDADV
ncbi:MAG: sigma 54-interacting transcriptional regulator [Gemmatimonadota bacterium]